MNTLDDYLNCDEYLGQPIGEDGFTRFQKGVNGEYYFAYIEQGKVIFRSEGYTTEKGRDNGIESVIKNEPLEKRYKLLEMANGKWGLSLRAGNHQEIAITCPMKTEEAAWMLLPTKRAAYLASLTMGTDSAGNSDDYLECKAYKGHPRTEKNPEFSTFNQDGEHYFALLNEKAKVLLRSEGYTTEKSRDNGIRSVQKNRVIEARYKTVEEEGKHYLILKAGNHQEIGRSCSFRTLSAAIKAIPKVIRASAPTDPVSASEDYLDCGKYEGHERIESEPAFSIFSHEGESYFTLLDNDGKVLLRSEGYLAEKSRDNGIRSVQKNRTIEKRFKTIEEEGSYYLILKAGNHQEIGRSCPCDSEAAALALMPLAMNASGQQVIAEEPIKVSKADDDDYLICDDYKGHQRSINFPEFSTFQKDGQFYFALLDDDNNVVLRSEGYTKVASRNNGIRSVMKNKDIEARRSVKEKFGYYFLILKAGNHQEIGRSCALENEAAALALLAPLAITGLAAEPIVDVLVPPVVEVPETPLVEELVEEASNDLVAPLVGAAVVGGAGLIENDEPEEIDEPEEEEYVAPIHEAAAAAASTGGIGGCLSKWWWLLAILLLLLLMWLMRGCFGCGAVVDAEGTDTTTPTEEKSTTDNTIPKDTKADITVETEAAKLTEEKVAKTSTGTGMNSLQSLYYDYNTWDLRQDATDELNKLLSILDANPDYKVKFLGHTDTRGARARNERLSRKRAQAAIKYLNERGIKKARMSWEKFSADQPKAKNDVESERKLQLNRRVDILVSKDKEVLFNTEVSVPVD